MLWYGTVGVCMNICSTLTVQYAILILVDLSITPFTCDIVGLPSLHRGYRVDSLGVVRIVDFAYHTTAHTPSARCPSDVPIPVSERGFSSCALSEVSCRTQMRSRCPHEQLRFFGGEGPLFTSTTEVSVAAELGNFIGTLGVHWVLTSRDPVQAHCRRLRLLLQTPSFSQPSRPLPRITAFEVGITAAKAVPPLPEHSHSIHRTQEMNKAKKAVSQSQPSINAASPASDRQGFLVVSAYRSFGRATYKGKHSGGTSRLLAAFRIRTRELITRELMSGSGAGRALSAFGQSRGHPTLMVLYEDREANEFFMTLTIFLADPIAISPALRTTCDPKFNGVKSSFDFFASLVSATRIARDAPTISMPSTSVTHGNQHPPPTEEQFADMRQLCSEIYYAYHARPSVTDPQRTKWNRRFYKVVVKIVRLFDVAWFIEVPAFIIGVIHQYNVALRAGEPFDAEEISPGPRKNLILVAKEDGPVHYLPIDRVANIWWGKPPTLSAQGFKVNPQAEVTVTDLSEHLSPPEAPPSSNDQYLAELDTAHSPQIERSHSLPIERSGVINSALNVQADPELETRGSPTHNPPPAPNDEAHTADTGQAEEDNTTQTRLQKNETHLTVDCTSSCSGESFARQHQDGQQTPPSPVPAPEGQEPGMGLRPTEDRYPDACTVSPLSAAGAPGSACTRSPYSASASPSVASLGDTPIPADLVSFPDPNSSGYVPHEEDFPPEYIPFQWMWSCKKRGRDCFFAPTFNTACLDCHDRKVGCSATFRQRSALAGYLSWRFWKISMQPDRYTDNDLDLLPDHLNLDDPDCVPTWFLQFYDPHHTPQGRKVHPPPPSSTTIAAQKALYQTRLSQRQSSEPDQASPSPQTKCQVELRPVLQAVLERKHRTDHQPALPADFQMDVPSERKRRRKRAGHSRLSSKKDKAQAKDACERRRKRQKHYSSSPFAGRPTDVSVDFQPMEVDDVERGTSGQSHSEGARQVMHYRVDGSVLDLRPGTVKSVQSQAPSSDLATSLISDSCCPKCHVPVCPASCNPPQPLDRSAVPVNDISPQELTASPLSISDTSSPPVIQTSGAIFTTRYISPPPRVFASASDVSAPISDISEDLNRAIMLATELAKEGSAVIGLAESLLARMPDDRPASTGARLDLLEPKVAGDLAKVITFLAKTGEGIQAVVLALRGMPMLSVHSETLRDMLSTLDGLRDLYKTTWDGIHELQTAVLWYRDQLHRTSLDVNVINTQLDTHQHECTGTMQHIADTVLNRISDDIRSVGRHIKEPLDALVDVLAQSPSIPHDIVEPLKDLVHKCTTALVEIAQSLLKHTTGPLGHDRSTLAHEVIYLRTRVAALENNTEAVDGDTPPVGPSMAPYEEVAVVLADLRARIERLEAREETVIEAGVKAYLAQLGLTEDKIRTLAVWDGRPAVEDDVA
ncbi:hypothetical protein C8Q76DRAFT_697534 [Earliella scabrosa]|nr:hypothetical protein C8Q76DRAFT_697534 [Earliella scabrosa]